MKNCVDRLTNLESCRQACGFKMWLAGLALYLTPSSSVAARKQSQSENTFSFISKK